MKCFKTALLFVGITLLLNLKSYGQTVGGLAYPSGTSDTLTNPDPTIVLMYKGEPFPYEEGVAIRMDQWRYIIRREQYTKAVEIAVRAQKMPDVVVAPPVKDITPRDYRNTCRGSFWVGFGLGAMAIAIVSSL